MPESTTVVDSLLGTPAGDRLQLTFLADGTTDSAVTWDRAELVAEVERYATVLLDRGVRPGDRVVLAMSPGPALVAAGYATMLVGAVVVTAFPPRREKDVARFTAIIRDCAATAVLADDATLPSGTPADGPAGEIPVLCPADAAGVGAVDGAARDARPAPSATALVQYTSGSTGTPRGVVVTHENLVSNSATVQHYFGDTPHSVFTWLPPYHDMGLIGTLLYPIHHGHPVVAMSPLHFVQDPLRWLRGMSHHRSDVTMAPNFALDLCVREVERGAPVTGIDLTHLRSLACGSEPVLETTVRRFVETFAGCGLDPDAVMPAYGLAEATLFACGRRRGEPRRSIPAPSSTGDHGVPAGPVTTVTGCGHAAAGHEIAVVDPDTRRRAGPGEIGEIWVSGPNVAAGYFGRPDLHAGTFAATTVPPDGRTYLRTGDLGLLDDELFVLGRMDDMIIVDGRNIYPHDVEAAIAQAHPDIVRVAVVGLADGGGQRLGVLGETAAVDDPPGDSFDLAVRATVVGQFGTNPAMIRIGGRLTVPTTTSGKPRRSEAQRIMTAARDGESG